MSVISKIIQIPIYDVNVLFVASDNIEYYYQRYANIFGELKGDAWAGICCASGNGNFGVFFKLEQLSINLISHEIFHLTLRILEHNSIPVEERTGEVGALLHGYLMDVVMKTLKKTISDIRKPKIQKEKKHVNKARG
jgi:hypothetical protein